MKKVLKIIFILLLAATVLAVGWFVVVPLVKGGSDFNENVAYVNRLGGTNDNIIFLSNRYSAVIESQEVISVDSDSEKKIKTIYVKEGDPIKKGDKLFEYDIEDLQYQLDQYKLDREQAEAEIKSYNDQIAALEKEQSTATRNQRLTLENQIEAAKLGLKKAEYNKSTVEKTIVKSENSIKNAVVKSSIDGIIRSVDDPTAEAYITITSSGDYRVKASVSEEHIGEFFVDEPILIRSRVDESKTWTGSVVSIDTAKPSNSNPVYGLETTTKYPVYISLDSIDGLLIGQHVTVEEARGNSTADKEDDDKVYIDDSFVCDATTAPYVWTDDNGKLAKRSVKLGEHDNELFRYEIISGLTNDDYVAFPEDRFFEGMETIKGYDESAEISGNSIEEDIMIPDDIAG